jgi:mannose-6-phosphate isomerase-like protein (cupin superfamily)
MFTTTDGKPVEEIRAVRYGDLEPFHMLPHSQTPGYMRWIKAYAGNEDYPDLAPPEGTITSGPIPMLQGIDAGNYQWGPHSHTIIEFYIILQGRGITTGVNGGEAVDPLDCVFVPKHSPHGVRSVGDEDLILIAIHEEDEPADAIVYFADGDIDPDADYPGQSVIRFEELAPRWAVEGDGNLRRSVSYIGGPEGTFHLNRGDGGMVGDRVSAGVTVISPGNAHVVHSHATTESYIIARGRAEVIGHPEIEPLGFLDALLVPENVEHGLRALGDEPLYVVWLHDEQLREDGSPAD